jgi:hypothetical protein
MRRSGAITHGAVAISLTARNTKAATRTHGNTAHRYLASLEQGVRAAGAESRTMRARNKWLRVVPGRWPSIRRERASARRA